MGVSLSNNATPLVTPSARAITPKAQAMASAVLSGHTSAPMPNRIEITPYRARTHQLR